MQCPGCGESLLTPLRSATGDAVCPECGTWLAGPARRYPRPLELLLGVGGVIVVMGSMIGCGLGVARMVLSGDRSLGLGILWAADVALFATGAVLIRGAASIKKGHWSGQWLLAVALLLGTAASIVLSFVAWPLR
jgi:hypothetical protein